MGNQPYYHSTRGEERCSPKEAILKGIASDGGLFVWDDLDQVQLDLHTFLQLDYPGMVQTLFRRLEDPSGISVRLSVSPQLFRRDTY